jgi:hypothetical protein
MRGPRIALLIAGLALYGGPAFSQSAQALHAPQTLSQSSQAAAPRQRFTQAPQAPQAPAPPRQTFTQASQAPQPRYSADALYNLGNSYARAGKRGLAVLNYERAALLAPDDADIRANLQFVRASAHIPAPPRSGLARIAEATSPAVAAWLGVLGLALVGVGMVAGRMTSRFRLARASSIVAGIALVVLTVSSARLQWPRMHAAVILVNQTPVRVSPVPMGDTVFVLPEAETVTLTAEHEDFVLVRTGGGRSGWVARANVGAVVPLKDR